MIRSLLIIILMWLCHYTMAQEKDFADHPFREISVNCPIKNVGRISCLFIQSRNELDSIYDGGKSKINFFKEVILGVSVSKHFHSRDSYDDKILNYKIKDSNIIHAFVYYEYSKSKAPFSRKIWIAVQKPIENYEIHVHVINIDGEDSKTVIFNAT